MCLETCLCAIISLLHDGLLCGLCDRSAVLANHRGKYNTLVHHQERIMQEECVTSGVRVPGGNLSVCLNLE